MPEDDVDWIRQRYPDACPEYPDMRNENKGYRDCPGCILVCARLGTDLSDGQ